MMQQKQTCPLVSTGGAAGILAALLLTGTTQFAQAQLGSGWTVFSPTKKIHLDDEAGLQTFNWTSYKSVCSPICADYAYDSGTDTETFRILDNRSNRSEIRLQNDYSSGRRQFQGYVLFNSPLNDESLFQIFGHTDRATLTMMRGYSDSGGRLYATSGAGTLSTGCYGVERRVNVIHDQNKYVQFYINGSLAGSFTESDTTQNYWKYGCYGTLTTPAVTVKWRQARCYQDGQPPRVELFQHTSYGGWVAPFVVGDYTTAQLTSAGAVNNDASSIKVPSGYRVILYDGDNFSGASITKTANDSSLIDDSFNDKVSSMRVQVNK